MKGASPCTFLTHSGSKRRGFGKVRVTAEDSVSPSETIADDYYEVLGLVMHQTITSFPFTLRSLFEKEKKLRGLSLL